ncbi:CTP-dependent riboflavin kinase [Candidatus Micrarchaeota archaeon]|nr:CTP-dependent riboflavin kinase [Candidatus Micrarchaeota archaeon]
MIKPNQYDLLLLLLKKRGDVETVITTTNELAEALEMSQQSISRWLIELEQEGFIKRTVGGLMLTDRGILLLKKIYSVLKESLGKEKEILFTGFVTSGVKDGRYYLSLPAYKKKFKETFGFIPYPGTLNVKVDQPEKKLLFMDRKGIRIEGFNEGGRFFGGLKAFNGIMNNLKIMLLIPDRSHYGPEVIELISDKFLRKKFKLKDGDKIKVKIVP